MKWESIAYVARTPRGWTSNYVGTWHWHLKSRYSFHFMCFDTESCVGSNYSWVDTHDNFVLGTYYSKFGPFPSSEWHPRKAWLGRWMYSAIQECRAGVCGYTFCYQYGCIDCFYRSRVSLEGSFPCKDGCSVFHHLNYIKLFIDHDNIALKPPVLYIMKRCSVLIHVCNFWGALLSEFRWHPIIRFLNEGTLQLAFLDWLTLCSDPLLHKWTFQINFNSGIMNASLLRLYWPDSKMSLPRSWVHYSKFRTSTDRINRRKSNMKA